MPTKKTTEDQPESNKTTPAPAQNVVEPVQHVPGQVEVPPAQPQEPAQEIPAEGNNIASVVDRSFADTPPANFQPPVEKTFVSPKD